MVSEGRDVHIDFLTDRGLIAVQGPGMASALQPLTDIDLTNLTFMTSRPVNYFPFGTCTD